MQETRAGSKTVAAWDKIENYTNWCIEWLNECSRVLKPNGVLYFWHNDMAQIAELLHEIAQITARQKEDMQMRLTAEMVNAAVFTPRELQTTRLWTMVPDDAENVLYADNVPVAWEGGKVE